MIDDMTEEDFQRATLTHLQREKEYRLLYPDLYADQSNEQDSSLEYIHAIREDIDISDIVFDIEDTAHAQVTTLQPSSATL